MLMLLFKIVDVDDDIDTVLLQGGQVAPPLSGLHIWAAGEGGAVGKTVEAALKMQVPDKDGDMVRYKKSDFQYDVKAGFIRF